MLNWLQAWKAPSGVPMSSWKVEYNLLVITRFTALVTLYISKAYDSTEHFKFITSLNCMGLFLFKWQIILLLSILFVFFHKQTRGLQGSVLAPSLFNTLLCSVTVAHMQQENDGQTDERYLCPGKKVPKGFSRTAPVPGSRTKVPDRFAGSLARPKLLRKVWTCDFL